MTDLEGILTIDLDRVGRLLRRRLVGSHDRRVGGDLCSTMRYRRRICSIGSSAVEGWGVLSVGF